MANIGAELPASDVYLQNWEKEKAKLNRYRT